MKTKSRALRFFVVVLVALFALACLVGFAACGEECEHENVTWSQTVDATCGEDGYRTGICDDCGEDVTEVLPATGDHSWDDGVVTKEATVDEEGETTYTCTICGETKTEAIDKVAYMTDDDVVTLVQALNNLDNYEGSYTVTNHFLEKRYYQEELREDENSWGVYSYDAVSGSGYSFELFTDNASNKTSYKSSSDNTYSLQQAMSRMDFEISSSVFSKYNCTTVKECELVFCCWSLVRDIDFSETGWGKDIEPEGDYVFEMTKTGNTYTVYYEGEYETTSEEIEVKNGQISEVDLVYEEPDGSEWIKTEGCIFYEYDESYKYDEARFDSYYAYINWIMENMM